MSKTGIKGLFKTPTDVLRYIIAAYAHKPFEGQITKPDLKDRKVKIPTSARKWLLNELDVMGTPKRICEDMFTYEAYWKLMHRYLRYGKAANARKRFVNYHKAIDLLYDGDRSWTFNGRYSSALQVGDYHKALDVARERTGFLMRNFMNFLRYPAGTKIAQAMVTKTATLDPMAASAQGSVVLTDDIDFFRKTGFAELIANGNSKLAFQLLEQLQSKKILRDQSERVVQGITKKYSTPIPGVKKQTAKSVANVIQSGIRLKLHARNKNVGKVFIATELMDCLLQYSGRTSTELNYSGSMLTPGSKIDIPLTPILRVGVLWRGQSTDIDHNASVFAGDIKLQDVYFGHPTYLDTVNSSGDITSCGPENFSAEFIDIDMKKIMENHKITSVITSLISYSGHPRTIGKLECYLFIKGLNKADRKIRGRQFKMDLMDTDYATRLDPDNVEDSTDYIGYNIQLDEQKIQVCAYTAKETGMYNTIRQRDYTPEYLEGIFGAGYTLYEALELAFAPDQITLIEDEADIVFGPNGIDPGTELETIHKYLF